MLDRMICAIAAAIITCSATADLHHDQTDQTNWYYLTNVDLDAVNELIDEGNRLIDLEIEQAQPLRFNVVAVANSGAYSSGWWWYYGATIPEIQDLLVVNDARLMDVEVYQTKAGLRFAVIMKPADGSDAVGETDWEFGLSGTGVESWINANPTRRVHDLVPYETIFGTRYAFTWINNTGDEASNWWYYLDRTLDNIEDMLEKNNARLIDLERHEDGRWSALMLPKGDDPWWWFYGMDPFEVEDLAVSRGARIVDFERYPTSGGDRVAVVLRRNVNDLTLQANARLRDDLSTFSNSGIYCRELNGSTLAGTNSSRVFEPASVIKTFHHYTAMRFVSANADSLAQTVTYLRPPSGNDSSRPCDADGTWNSTTETLFQTLIRMMVNSDNHATEAIRARYGTANIENLASAVGASDTALNHIIGCFCGSDRNETTLRDLADIHAAVASGILGNSEDDFHDIMINSLFNSVLQAELASSGLSAEDVAEFSSRALEATKGGSYTCSSLNEAHRSRAGYFRLPTRRKDCSIIDREYFIGAWINDAESTEGNQANGNVYDATEFLYRELIQSAIASWRETGCEPCFGDLNGDGIVDGADQGLLLAQWGSCPSECSGDLDGDGDVDGADLGLFLSAWGPCF